MPFLNQTIVEADETVDMGVFLDDNTIGGIVQWEELVRFHS